MIEKITTDRMRPIRDEVYLSLRKAILRGVYPPGARLQEEQLAAELGTSRTPVREALRKLEVEKIVTHYPHKGTIVSEIFFDELEDLYLIRTFVETIIAKRAALNAIPADVEYLSSLLDHEEAAVEVNEIIDSVEAYNDAISKIADCPNIGAISEKVRETLSRMIVSSHLNPQRRPDAQKEHRQIVEAIGDNNAELAQTLTKKHLAKAGRLVKNGENTP